MNHRTFIACAVVALGAAAARADVATGGSIAIDVTAPNTSTLVSGNIGAVDGNYFLTVDGTAGGNDSIVFDTTWAAGSMAPRFEITVGAVTGSASISSIWLSDGVETYAYTLPAPFSLTANSTNVVDVDLNDAINGLDLLGGYGSYNLATFTIAFTAGSTFQIDAISNPEPGTWALFGLGTAALGAWVRRRRRGAPARTAV